MANQLNFIKGFVSSGKFRTIIIHDAFNESDHPRAENGEFGNGQGKVSKEDKFKSLINGKSDSDKSHFLAAKADGVAIPPAWTNVIYHGKEGKNGIMVNGTDGKSRKQVLEANGFRDSKIVEKHERIRANLFPKFDEIKNTLKEKAAKGDEEAKVLYLIANTAFRIGGKGDGKAEVAAFGATTLQGEHVKVDGDNVTFAFPGKKGVQQIHTITDPIIADMVKNKKTGEKIFKTSDTKVRKAWKSVGGEKVHDIRSLIATRLAAEVVKDLPEPKTEYEADLIKKKASEVAAKVLGNNPSESLVTYIDHNIFKKELA